MKQIKSILLLLLISLSPLQLFANINEAGGGEINIPEIVLEHLSDSYEWHIASYEGKHISIPLPIIVCSRVTGDWYVGTAHNLPEKFGLSS